MMLTMLMALALQTAPAAEGRADPGPVPVGNPAAWVTPDDYPAAAMRANMQGTLSLKVAVDAAGAVSGCEVVSSSGWLLLDAQTCALIQSRAQFRPAKDKAGRAIASTWQGKLTWRLPGSPAILGSWARATQMLVQPDGAIPGCAMQASGPAAQADYCLAARFLADDGRSTLLGGAAPATIVVREIHAVDGGAAPDLPIAQGMETLFSSRIRYTVSASGEITSCSVEESKGTDVFHMLDGGCDPALDYPAMAADAGKAHQVTFTRDVLRERSAGAGQGMPATKQPGQPQPPAPPKQPMQARPGETIA